MTDPSARYDSLIRFYAAQHARDPRQVKHQLRQESAFRPHAVSPCGAKGLAQFMDPTWREWGAGGNPFDPEEAIHASCRYMAYLELTFGSLPPALAAYNAGLGRVRQAREAYGDRWLSALPEETQRYVTQCLAYDQETLA